MKKFSLILVAIMLIGTFTACKNSKDTLSDNSIIETSNYSSENISTVMENESLESSSETSISKKSEVSITESEIRTSQSNSITVSSSDNKITSTDKPDSVTNSGNSQGNSNNNMVQSSVENLNYDFFVDMVSNMPGRKMAFTLGNQQSAKNMVDSMKVVSVKVNETEAQITENIVGQQEVFKVFESRSVFRDDNDVFQIEQYDKWIKKDGEPLTLVFFELDGSLYNEINLNFEIWLDCKKGNTNFQHLIKYSFYRDGYGAYIE